MVEGGYPIDRFDGKVEEHLLCPICGNVLKDPVSCNNDHIFCGECITLYLQNSATCYSCEEKLDKDNLRVPILARKLLGKLKIKCTYAKRGCKVFVQINELSGHEESCGFFPKECENKGCTEVVNFQDYAWHKDAVCEHRNFSHLQCEKTRTEAEIAAKTIESLSKEVCNMNKQIDTIVSFRASKFSSSNDVVIIGGIHGNTDYPTKNVEIYSWKNKIW